MNIAEILDKEGLQIAPDSKRILAFVIDDIIIAMLLFIAFFDKFVTLNGDMEAIMNLSSSFAIYIVVLKLIYQTIFTAIYGGSIGKIICKIKIIKIDTLNKPNIAESFLRSSIRVISELLFYIPLVIAFGDSFKRALHDISVKTIVIDVGIPQELD